MPKRRYSYYSTQFQDPGKDFFSLLFIVFFMLAILMTSFYQSLTKKIESPQTSSKSGNKEVPNVSPPKNKIIYLKNINNKLYVIIDKKKYEVNKSSEISFLNKGIFKKNNKNYAFIYISKDTDIPVRTYQKIIDFFKQKKVKCEAFLEE